MSHRNFQGYVSVSSGAKDIVSTPWKEVETVIEQLLWQADTMSCTQCTHDERRHWQARGQEHTLRRAAHQLGTLLSSSSSPSRLGDALREYLACLEKCQIDAQEELHTSNAITSWKASGELQVWIVLIPALTSIADACAFHHAAATLDDPEHIPSSTSHTYAHRFVSTSLRDTEKEQLA